MRIEREQLLKDICGIFEDSPFLFFVTYKGMTVSDFTELRNQLADLGSECHVIKNSYIQKAGDKLDISSLSDLRFSGDTAVVSGSGDCCAIAKLLKEMTKKNKKLTFKGGVLNNKLLSVEQILDLAELPPLEVMRAILLGTLQAPKQKLVGVLNSKVASIVYALKAYLDKIEEAS